jgi:hypothetical protein
LTLWDDEDERVGLSGGSAAVGDDGTLGVLGEVGDCGGIGAFLGDSYDVLMNDGLGRPVLRSESLSSSDISDKVERSEYELIKVDIPVLSEAVDMRIVSVSDAVELIVDMVRSEAALEDIPSEDATTPTSYLCAPQ